jgi:hypothetical protein
MLDGCPRLVGLGGRFLKYNSVCARPSLQRNVFQLVIFCSFLGSGVSRGDW